MSHYFQEPKFSDHFSPSPPLLSAAVQTAIPLLPISPHPWLCNILKTTAANAYAAEVLLEKYSQLPVIQLSKWKPVREPTPPDQPALPAPQAGVLGTTSGPQTTSLGITVLYNTQSSYYSTPCSLSCSGYYFSFFPYQHSISYDSSNLRLISGNHAHTQVCPLLDNYLATNKMSNALKSKFSFTQMISLIFSVVLYHFR